MIMCFGSYKKGEGGNRLTQVYFLLFFLPKQKYPLTSGPSTCAIDIIIFVLLDTYLSTGTPPILQEATHSYPASGSDAIFD